MKWVVSIRPAKTMRDYSTTEEQQRRIYGEVEVLIG